VILTLNDISVSKNANRLKVMTIIINVVLYSIFIAIVIAFAASKESNQIICNGLYFKTADDVAQRVISLIYSVIIAAISLAIGSAFLIFGMKLYLQLSRASNASGIMISTKVAYVYSLLTGQIFLTSLLCCIAFLFHCAFIIILVSLNTPVIEFSFVGFITTQVIPAWVMLLLSFKLQRQRTTEATVAVDTSSTSSGSSASSSSTDSGSIDMQDIN
jgi:hypothetical protein